MSVEPGRFFTRHRVRRVLGLLVLTALAGVAVQLARSQWAQHLRSLRTNELDFLPEVAQRIQNFRRVKMEGDRKVWEVAAREAQYFEDDQEIVVEQPEVSFYMKDDQGAVSLRGDHGRIHLSGREMERVELEGSIEVRFRDYIVRTERAVYQQASDTVVAPSVTVTGSGLDLKGGRMTVEMQAQRLRVDGQVETVLEQAAAEG
jgi:LPS export ABC transporter protein LptC